MPRATTSTRLVRRPARRALGRGHPGAGLDDRPPDRPPAVDRPGRADRRSPTRPAFAHGAGRRRRRIRAASSTRAPRRSSPLRARRAAGRLAATQASAARRAADRARRPQAAVVRAADERRVDGDRAADGDLGARARRRRRARCEDGPPTARLRSIAHIGVRTRDFAFAINGLAPPADPFRVELRAPDGYDLDVGTRGRRAAGHGFGGGLLHCWSPSAGRGRPSTSRPRVTDAQRWLTIAQAFAGPPGPGR